MEEGQTVALVSDAGTPLISDPGARLIDEAVGAGIDVDVLPGPSAVIAAAALSGLGSEGFCFGGFLPRAAAARRAALERLDRAGLAVVLFESPNRLASLLELVAAADPQRAVVVCRELTKLHQEAARGSAAELAARFAGGTRGEVTVVLAPVADEPLAVDPEALANLAAAVGAARAAELAARLTGAPRNELYRVITSK
jgi:16S rRNA (cytidine1402-2'-O)-methyltransferase